MLREAERREERVPGRQPLCQLDGPPIRWVKQVRVDLDGGNSPRVSALEGGVDRVQWENDASRA